MKVGDIVESIYGGLATTLQSALLALSIMIIVVVGYGMVRVVQWLHTIRF